MSDNLYKTKLPWILGLVFFAIYFISLNYWVSVDTLSVLAPVMGWDFWSLQMNHPIFQLIMLPFSMLPERLAIIGINLLGAFLASMTLVWLARSVMLLPQDRFYDQSIRNDDPDGIYEGKFFWLPPVLAVCSLGLLFNFWVGATNILPQILNVFFLSYIIRNTLEHRLDDEDHWIYKAAVVYSIALVNNWLMVLFFPLWVGAILWINIDDPRRFLRLMIRSFFFFLPGLIFFLYIPIAEAIAAKSDLGFWDLLKMSLGIYVRSVASIPLYMLFIFSTFSIIPLIFLSIRWDAKSDGGNGFDAILTRGGLGAMNLIFFFYSMAIAFDLPLCPRYLSPGFYGLEFHLIAALVMGYTAGYLMVVFGEKIVDSRKKREKTGIFMKIFSPLMLGIVFITGVGMIGGLIYLNYPVVKAYQGDSLYLLGKNFLQDINKNRELEPDKGMTLFADEARLIYLVKATQARMGDTHKDIFVNTQYISYPWYHRRMEKFFPDRWKDLTADAPRKIYYLDNPMVIQWMYSYSKTEEIYYLHPSFGYFFEACRPTPAGILTKLTPYDDKDLSLWKLTPEEAQQAIEYWKGIEDTIVNTLHPVQEDVKGINNPEDYVSYYYSRVLNNYGVELNKIGMKEQSLDFCRKALELNPNNLSAMLNLNFYETGAENLDDEATRKKEKIFSMYRSEWPLVLTYCGVLDVPTILSQQGLFYTQGHLWRQAFQCFLRVEEFAPDNIHNMISLAYADFMIGESERALSLIRKAKDGLQKAKPNDPGMATLTLQEAGCLITLGRLDEARALLDKLRLDYPADNRIEQTLIRLLFERKEYDLVLPMIDRQLKIAPDDPQLRYRKALCLLGLERDSEALTLLDGLYHKNPDLTQVSQLRRSVLLKMGKFKEVREEYESDLIRNENNVRAMMGLGDVAEREGRKEDALEWYNKAMTNRAAVPYQIEWIEDRLNKMTNGSSISTNNVPPVDELFSEPGNQLTNTEALKVFSK